MRILEATGDDADRTSTPSSRPTSTPSATTGIPIDRRAAQVLGLAVDVGTTTVVFRLIDLLSGRTVAGGALENPQRFGGSDVMTRISYERDHPGALRQALRRSLNQRAAGPLPRSRASTGTRSTRR